jgi:hypothetical protein
MPRRAGRLRTRHLTVRGVRPRAPRDQSTDWVAHSLLWVLFTNGDSCLQCPTVCRTGPSSNPPRICTSEDIRALRTGSPTACCGFFSQTGIHAVNVPHFVGRVRLRTRHESARLKTDMPYDLPSHRMTRCPRTYTTPDTQSKSRARLRTPGFSWRRFLHSNEPTTASTSSSTSKDFTTSFIFV